MSAEVGRLAAGRFWHATCLLLFLLLALEAAQPAHAFDFDLNKMPDEQDFDTNETLETEPPAPVAVAPKVVPTFKMAFYEHELNELEGEEVDNQRGSRKRLKTEWGAAEQQTGLLGGLWSKVRSGLPDYFDFTAFRSKFKRKYLAAEAFVRQSIFLEKAMVVFKSRLAFRLGKKSYLESVNKFSDLSPQEFRLMFMASAPVEVAPKSAQAAHCQQEQIKRRQRELKELQKGSHLPELASQSAGAGGSLEGAPMSEQRARQLIERLYTDELGDRQFEEALLQELDGFNVETASRSANGIDQQVELPWPGQLKSSEVAADAEEAYAPPQLHGPGDALDWSKHECFHEVYEQGSSCGKCYVMATTALTEFYKCTERGPGRPVARRKFSKDYVLDCAQKWTPHTAGCAGGSPLHTLRFISTAGIFNIRDWRKRRTDELQAAREAGLVLDALDHRCPLTPDRTQLDQWGSIRVELNPKPVSAARWKEALQDGPIVASVQMPAEGVDSYAGGVHDGAGCATSGGWHAMLLVGYGTNERGQPFWRFRNSFGPDWGDRGHFDLSMEVPPACLAGGVRVFREPLVE